MTAPNFRLLRQYQDTNARLIPLCDWRATKTGKDGAVLKLGKTPNTKGWQDLSWTQEAMVEHMKSGSNVGFRCGGGWGIIDFDPRNDIGPDGQPRERKQWTLWRVLDDFGIRQGEFAVVETGGGGLHIYLRGIPDDYHGRERIEKYGPSVEFKTSPRRFVVCAGSLHPGAKDQPLPAEPMPYQWGHTSIALAKTLEAPAALLEAFAHEAPAEAQRGSGNENFGRFSPEQLEHVLRYIPVEDFGKQQKSQDHDWLNWMFACHWLTGGAGREEWIEWALGDVQYHAGHEELRARWDSCQANPRGVKSGLVFKMLDYYNAPEEAYPREKASSVVVPPDLEELEISQEPQSKEALALRYMNDRHAVVTIGNKTMIMRFTFDSLRQTMYPEFQKSNDTREFYANRPIIYSRVMPDGKSKVIDTNYFDFWFRHPERRQYYGVVFEPDQPQEILKPNGLHFNIWTPRPFDIEDGRGIGEWSALEEIMRENLAGGDPEQFEYLMDWLAYSVQNGVGPQRVALVMRGKKGIGKGTLATAWLKLFGRHGLATHESKEVFGQFNYRMREVQALFLDEAFWGGDKAVLGAVKSIITEGEISTEQKFADRFSVANHLKIMMATNEEWAVPADEDERRFVVLDCAAKYTGRHEIFQRAREQLYGPKNAPHTLGLRALYFDLMTRDIAKFDPERNRIETQSLRDQVREGFGSAGEWWYELLSDGVLPGMFDPDFRNRQTGPLADWENRPVAVPSRVLRDNLWDYITDRGQRPSGDLAYNFKGRWYKTFRRMLPESVEKRRVVMPADEDFLDAMAFASNGSNTADVIILPPLGVCRQEMSDRLGFEFMKVEAPVVDDLV